MEIRQQKFTLYAKWDIALYVECLQFSQITALTAVRKKEGAWSVKCIS